MQESHQDMIRKLKSHTGLPDSTAGMGGDKMRKSLHDARVDKFMSALASVLQQTDRILTGQPITVRLSDPDHDRRHHDMAETPAWTDRKTIFLNSPMMRRVFDRDKQAPGMGGGSDVAASALRDAVMTFKGTNYHEVAHCLFTPGTDTDFHRAVVQQTYRHSKSYWHAFMMLEDQRIETFYTSVWRATTPYFVKTACEWLLYGLDESQYGTAYPLMAGRKYLPGRLRSVARASYVSATSEQQAQEVDAIVDEYVTLPLPLEWQKAIDLINRLFKLLAPSGALVDDNHGTKCGRNTDHGQGGTSELFDVDNVVRAATEAEDIVAQDRDDRENKTGEWGSHEASETADDVDDVDDGDDGTGSGAGDESDSDDSCESPGMGGDDAASDDEPDPGETTCEPGTAGGKGDSPVPESDPDWSPNDMLRELIEDTLVEAGIDDKFNEDVDGTIKSIVAQVNDGNADGAKYTKYMDRPASADAVAAARRITARLQMLRTDLEAAWLRDSPVGRIDVSRVVRRSVDPTITEVFTAWDEGAEEDAETEVVILVDLSTSMGNLMDKVSESLWILKRAFDRAEVRTTVLGFSDGNATLYKPTEKVHATNYRSFGTWGGTDPYPSLVQAHKILSNSSATNTVLIAITDGAWERSGLEKADSLVGSMRRRGASTTLFSFGDTFTQHGTHNFEDALVIFQPSEIVRVADRIVESIVKRALAGHA